MMRSATAFLPDSMITFMNLERSTEPNFGSGRMSRLGTSRRRGIALPSLLQLAAGDARASKGHPGLHLLEQPARGPAPFALESYAFFGRLAPYLERDCLRSLTPCRSSDPRTM